MVAAPSGVTQTICQAILETPIRIYDWTARKVKELAEAVFGYIVRIVTFQMGERHRPLAAWIMRAFQKINSDPREEKPFDPERLERSTKFLISYGGVEVQLRSQNASVHAMTLKSEDFFNALADKGATIETLPYQGHYRRMLLNPPIQDVEKFYLELIDITIGGVEQKAVLLPSRCDITQPPHILHSHSPGRSMCMDRKFIGLHLAAGYDITIWDPRGTAESTGIPSEGGYYLDAEAVFNWVRSQGVSSDRIYASGFCKGAGIAAHLKKKFHAEGVHFIASNPYTSIEEVIKGYGFVGRLGAKYGLKAIQDPSLNVEQDYFNVVKKLASLDRHYSGGKAIFIHTDTDQMMPPNTVEQLKTAFGDAGLVREILRKHPDPEANGHMQPPYEDPAVWNRYVGVVI